MTCLHHVPQMVQKIMEYQALLESKQLRVGDSKRSPDLMNVVKKNITAEDLVTALHKVESDDIELEQKLSRLSKSLIPYELPRGMTSLETVITNALVERPDLVYDFFKNTHSCLILLSLVNTMMYRAAHGIRCANDLFKSVIDVGCCGAEVCSLREHKLQMDIT